jgi:hypothetical protein
MSSFELARQTTARNWEAESARIEQLNAGQVEIYTASQTGILPLPYLKKSHMGFYVDRQPLCQQFHLFIPANQIMVILYVEMGAITTTCGMVNHPWKPTT